jgi:ATP-dependent DNA ligase
MARRDPVGIRLLTRNGHDWAPRYPLIVEALNALKVRSCLIDGEAVVCDDDGRAVFERRAADRHTSERSAIARRYNDLRYSIRSRFSCSERLRVKWSL